MLSIQKKLVVHERGQPQEVIISWEQYLQIIEMLGLDLDDAAIADLREAQQDRIAEKRDAYCQTCRAYAHASRTGGFSFRCGKSTLSSARLR